MKAYYALKLSGVSPNNKLMKLAKEFIIKNGGAEQSNVFTRITLAQFGQISWEAIPFMPIEIINLSKLIFFEKLIDFFKLFIERSPHPSRSFILL